MDQYGQYWKSILAFASLLGTNLVAVVVDPKTSAILPQTSGQWVAAIVSTLGGTLLVWGKSNTPVPISK